jgi:hypothetical protein
LLQDMTTMEGAIDGRNDEGRRRSDNAALCLT